MPTKPHKNIKSKLQEAIEKSTKKHRRKAKPLTRKRVTYCGIAGILFGWLGIHNFMMHRPKRAFGHIIYSAITFDMFAIPLIYAAFVVYQCRHGKECIDITSYDDTLNVVVIVGLILFITSVIWGVVEGIILIANRSRFPVEAEPTK